MGQQVADLLAYNAADVGEVISSGRTLDYASKIYLDDRGSALFEPLERDADDHVEDVVGRHDFLLTPCSKDTFRIIYGDSRSPSVGASEISLSALEPFGVAPDAIPVAFNCFMNVPVDPVTGALSVLPPLSRPGDYIKFRAEMDLIIGLTACSALQSNGGSFKPIAYKVT